MPTFTAYIFKGASGEGAFLPTDDDKLKVLGKVIVDKTFDESFTNFVKIFTYPLADHFKIEKDSIQIISKEISIKEARGMLDEIYKDDPKWDFDENYKSII